MRDSGSGRKDFWRAASQMRRWPLEIGNVPLTEKQNHGETLGAKGVTVVHLAGRKANQLEAAELRSRAEE